MSSAQSAYFRAEITHFCAPKQKGSGRSRSPSYVKGQNASQPFANGAVKESPIIFFGGMCGEENTSQAASVEFVRSRLQPF
ncbi:MAG: hypothetical protein U0O13_00760, partial [Oscillospiraceae bacterium]